MPAGARYGLAASIERRAAAVKTLWFVMRNTWFPIRFWHPAEQTGVRATRHESRITVKVFQG